MYFHLPVCEVLHALLVSISLTSGTNYFSPTLQGCVLVRLCHVQRVKMFLCAKLKKGGLTDLRTYTLYAYVNYIGFVSRTVWYFAIKRHIREITIELESSA